LIKNIHKLRKTLTQICPIINKLLRKNCKNSKRNGKIKFNSKKLQKSQESENSKLLKSVKTFKNIEKIPKNHKNTN